MPLAEAVRKSFLTQRASGAEEVVFRLATSKDAESIVSCYEHVFGEGGVKALGHEAYPAPDVFCVDGVLRVIADPKREFVVAELEGQVVGGMIINFLSPYNCEFACVSVDPSFQGLGISPKMLAYARSLADQSSLTVNNTEIVTHSVLSQTSHNKAGYDKITAFGYCQYPRVFFKNNPESCLWIGEIQGKVAQALRSSRLCSSGGSLEQTFAGELSSAEQTLFDYLSKPRNIFMPPMYKGVVSGILRQFIDVIDYRLGADHSVSADNVDAVQMSDIDFAGDEPYAYLKLPAGLYDSWQADLDAKIETIKSIGKRFIQAKIAANYPAAVSFAKYLQARGFVLLGFLPLYQFHSDTGGFDDLLVLQWVAPNTVAENPLPGETDSVIKLYGYPANLAGDLLKIIRRELRTIDQRSGVEVNIQ